MTDQQLSDIPYIGRVTGVSIAGPMAHRAGWVLVDSNTALENGYIVIENEKIAAIGQGKTPSDIQTMDHGPGVLMPPLVNAHTHLELSALQGKIDCAGGFRFWVRELIRQREALDSGTICKGAQEGARMLHESGCGLVGEISTLGLSRDIFREAQFSGIWFQELIGNPTEVDSIEISEGFTSDKAFSLAGHGPHTTAPQRLIQLKESTLNAKLPFSIHVAESEDEILFINTGKGPWADLLKERNINFSDWPIKGKTPVQYLSEIGLLDEKTLAVHLITAEKNDLALLQKAKVNVCLCLRSNQTLHGRLPDVEKMQQYALNLCLGTDSLASVDSLNIFKEMVFLADKFPGLSPNNILKMATYNGAVALGLADHFGTIEPGKSGKLLYIPVQAGRAEQLYTKIVHADFKNEIHFIHQ